MSKYIEPKSRDQIRMFTSFDDMVSVDNIVRIIDEIINQMNLSISDFVNGGVSNFGRPAHNPILLLKLYIYCYFNGIRSSRKIEKECTRNIELKWLMGEIVPDHKCIANFRKNNGEAIKKTFREFLTMCDMLGLLGKSIVAVDGTKVRANNSKKKCYTPNKLQEMLNYFEKRVIEYERILTENDEKEDYKESLDLKRTNINDIKDKLKETKAKIDEITTRKKEMQIKNIKQITMTDTDSRLMKTANKGSDIAYNAQIAVDSKNHIIVATDVTNQVSDVEQLSNMSGKVVENLNIEKDEKIIIIADKGYYSAAELIKCSEDKRIDPIVAIPGTAAPVSDEKYNIDNFKYDEVSDTYKCPEGSNLVNVSKPISKEQVYKNADACQTCENRNKCTKAACREISRTEKSKIKEEAKQKLSDNTEVYAERQKLAEHPFGTMKATLGFTNYLTRGIESVKIENILHILAYNFKRVINIYKNKGELCLINKLITETK
jgi:transposase